ncbi:hypothetical protein M407DRAFT_34167 [Tulasnella calospora MUT 4182]|uniref:DEAD-box RNA helicase Q domain-containing protein n=1 Tax=Tulasnella calospora MUT 4182 TaxID=1051891 RepID=A0A0C3L382_9AGAM|nr:hypothetical protein M407DRAFT_34167 [Tulasnella calospora MUT 4182]
MGKTKRHATEENDELTRASKKLKLEPSDGSVDVDESEKARLKAEKKERKRLKKLAKEEKRKEGKEGGEDTAVEQGDGTASPAESELKKTKKKSKKKIVENDASPLDASAPAPTAVPSRSASVSQISPAEASEFLASNSIRVMEGEVVPVISFDQLNIPDKLRPALSKFTKPTPIQSCSWPAALAGKDMVGIAETGRYDRQLES